MGIDFKLLKMATKLIFLVFLTLIAGLYVVSQADHKKYDEKTLLGMTARHIKTVSDQVSNSSIAKHEVTKQIVDNVSNAANTVHSHVKTHSSYLWTKINSDKDFHKNIDDVLSQVETKVDETKQRVFRALSTIVQEKDGFK